MAHEHELTNRADLTDSANNAGVSVCVIHRLDPADLRRRYVAIRELTEVFASPLGPEDQTVQSMPDVSPTKWHRAHTTWFFEEFVLGDTHPPHDPDYRYLFNSYYEAVGDRHPRHERGLLSRPTVDQVGEYRRVVDGRMGSSGRCAGPSRRRRGAVGRSVGSGPGVTLPKSRSSGM